MWGCLRKENTNEQTHSELLLRDRQIYNATSLQRQRTGGSEHRQLVKGHVASMGHRTLGPSAVQHLHSLSTAPIKGHSKGTFTFGEGTDLGLRRCGLYWFVCLLK